MCLHGTLTHFSYDRSGLVVGSVRSVEFQRRGEGILVPATCRGQVPAQRVAAQRRGEQFQSARTTRFVPADLGLSRPRARQPPQRHWIQARIVRHPLVLDPIHSYVKIRIIFKPDLLLK